MSSFQTRRHGCKSCGLNWTACVKISFVFFSILVNHNLNYILILKSQSMTAPFSRALDQQNSCSQSCRDCSKLIDRNMSGSTSQHWTNTQNLRPAKTLSPLISRSTSQPHNPQPKAKGKQESTPSTAESKQGRGGICISQSRPRHSGLGKSKQQH